MSFRSQANPNKLSALLAVHDAFCQSASNLTENVRPYSVQSRLEEIQKLIMEEIKQDIPTPKAKHADDNIPF